MHFLNAKVQRSNILLMFVQSLKSLLFVNSKNFYRRYKN